MESSKVFNEYLKKLSIIFLAFLGTLVFLAAVALYIRLSGKYNLMLDKKEAYIFYLIPVVFNLIQLPLAFFMHKYLLKRISVEQTPLRKLQQYFSMSMLRMALIQSAGTISLIFFLLSGNKNLLLIFMMALLFLLIVRPTKAKMLEDIPFKDKEQEDIENN